MTPKQDKKYWRDWNKACRVNGWHEEGGYLTLPEPKEAGPASTVIAAANHFADRNHRAPTMKDLRYGAHFVAVGRYCSHTEIHWRELSRLFVLFDLLADPLNLAALAHWNDPGLEAQEREEALIRQVPEAFVAGCVEKMTSFRTHDWQSLDDQERRALVIILSNAKDRWQKPMVPA